MTNASPHSIPSAGSGLAGPRNRPAWASLWPWLLAWVAIAGCGGADEPSGGAAALAARMRVSSAGSMRALSEVPITPTGYDSRSGQLTLRRLPVVQPGAVACFDAALRTVSTTPITLELQSASPMACTVDALDPTTAIGRYDDATGRLALPGLPVTDGTTTRCWDVTLHRTQADPIRVQLDTAIERPCGGSATSAFRGSVVLGAPTDRSVTLSVYSADQSGRVWIAYGSAATGLTQTTGERALQAGAPLTFTLANLATDTEHRYRLYYAPSGNPSGSAGAGEERRFHTARPPGSRFVFTMQADSHLDENSDLAVYQRTLDNIAADAPDFHIDLGDTFMTEKHTEPLSAVLRTANDPATVDARYAYEHANFGRMAHSVPLMLVNGNHDGELGWMNNGTDRNLAVWTTQARLRWFVNPLPDAFYSGDTLFEPFVGERAAWYAWHWGDALFVALDPFWNSAKLAGNDGWGMSLGTRQYQWLATTLAASSAKYKFVFIHNLVGGLDGQMRGGTEAAPYYEWGGKAADGSNAFATKRPGWPQPIHALLAQHRVTAVFHGHDHVYVKQDLDGIVYQEVPQPSAKNFSSGATLAKEYHYNSGTIQSSSGHLRVGVGPDAVNVSYVRAWLPSQENAQRRNGQVAESWRVSAPTQTTGSAR